MIIMLEQKLDSNPGRYFYYIPEEIVEHCANHPYDKNVVSIFNIMKDEFINQSIVDIGRIIRASMHTRTNDFYRVTVLV